MKIGDLVRHPHSVEWSGMCTSGLILKISPGDWGRGAMILWEHGEICYSPLDELEAISD